jgi:hypothetical protein
MLGVALNIRVERGAHYEESLVDRLRKRVDELAHLVEGPVEIVVRRVLFGAIDRGRRVAAGAIDLTLGHESVVDQIVEHDVGARARCRQVRERRELARRLEQAGEHCRFGERYVAHRFSEIIQRRGVDAEGAAAEIGTVEVELEDFVLGEPRLQPQREEGFVDLALDSALVRQEQVLGELLGDGGPALHHAAGLGIGHQRADGAVEVDAEMLVEAPILGRQSCLD